MRRLQNDTGFQSAPNFPASQTVDQSVAPGAKQFFQNLQEQTSARNSIENQFAGELMRMTDERSRPLASLNPMGVGGLQGAKMVMSMDPSAQSNNRIENVFENARNGQNPLAAVAADVTTQNRMNEAAADLAKAGRFMSVINSDVQRPNPLPSTNPNPNTQTLLAAVDADFNSKVIGNAVVNDFKSSTQQQQQQQQQQSAPAQDADLNPLKILGAVAKDINRWNLRTDHIDGMLLTEINDLGPKAPLPRMNPSVRDMAVDSVMTHAVGVNTSNQVQAGNTMGSELRTQDPRRQQQRNQ